MEALTSARARRYKALLRPEVQRGRRGRDKLRVRHKERPGKQPKRSRGVGSSNALRAARRSPGSPELAFSTTVCRALLCFCRTKGRLTPRRTAPGNHAGEVLGYTDAALKAPESGVHASWLQCPPMQLTQRSRLTTALTMEHAVHALGHALGMSPSL